MPRIPIRSANSRRIAQSWTVCCATRIRRTTMPAIGRTAKTQSQNLRQYKRIAVAAGVVHGKVGNGIAQPTLGAPWWSCPDQACYSVGLGGGIGRGLGVAWGLGVGVGP